MGNKSQKTIKNILKKFLEFFFSEKVSWYGAPYFLSSVLYDLYQTVARRRTMSSTSDECGRVEAGAARVLLFRQARTRVDSW